MSRDIRFRAWDGKRMIYYTLDDLLWVLVGTGTISPYPDKQNLRDLMMSWEGDNSEAMKQRFTGLTDKNGKEIYEGDILKNVKYGGSFFIQWGIKGESYAGWAGVWVEKRPDGVQNMSPMYNGPIENCKVIGNIHQNPELLKG